MPGDISERSGRLHQLIRLSGPMFAAIVSRGGQTILAFVLARSLGVAGYGEFIFAVGTALLVGNVAIFGWPNVVNREMPILIREASWGLLRGLVSAADIFVVSATSICALVLFLAASHVPHLEVGLKGAAILIVPTAFSLMRQQQLAAVDRATTGMLVDQGMAATMVLAIHFVLQLPVLGVIAVYASSMVVLVLLGTVIFRRRLPDEMHGAPPLYQWQLWLSSGASMFSSLLPRMLTTRFDVLMVAPLAGLVQAGLFGSALRVTLLMTFPQFVLQTIVMPRFSRAFAHGRLDDVRRFFFLCIGFAFVSTMPFIIPMVMAPSWMMSLMFGKDFAVGGSTLFWLGIGQLAMAFGIPLNAMIAMGGDHKSMGNQGIAVLACSFIAGWLLVPTYGSVAAAIITTVANITLVAGMVVLAWPIFRTFAKRRTAPSV